MNLPAIPFPLGTVVATRGILDAVSSPDILDALARHQAGDWGDLCDEDRNANELALRVGGRLLSAYISGSGESFWIITEADRSYTTLLLPEEY